MPTIDLLQFSGMLQTTTSSFLRRNDQLELCINGHGDEIGTLEGRIGYAQYGDTVGGSIRGLHSYNDVSGGVRYLLEYSNGQIKYSTVGNFTSIVTGLSANAKAEFITFLDQAFFFGADSSNNFLTTATIDGTTYSTITNVTGAPKAKYGAVFRDQLYLANVSISGVRYPDRFDYSSIPDVTASTITWDTATASGNFERVYPNNGEEIMGIHSNRYLNELLIFKETSMHAWDTVRIRDIANVGTSAHRSIKTVGFTTIFFNRNGIYAYSGGQPKLISRPIQKWIDGIDQSTLVDVFAENENDKIYKIFVGTITVNGVAYSNCEIRYSLVDNNFTIYSYANTFTAYTTHIISGTQRVYAGASNSKIYKLASKTDAVYDDDGTAIELRFMSKAFDLGVPSEKKEVIKTTIYSDRPQNLTGRYRVDDGDWSSHFGIDKTTQDININPSEGYKFQFHFSASYRTQPPRFQGISFTPRITTANHA